MIDDLLRDLTIAPVMGRFHPLVTLCLPPGTDVRPKARSIAVEMDDRKAEAVRPVLITEPDQAYADRFITRSLTELPDVDRINAGLPLRLDAARSLLTNKRVAGRIAEDALRRGYRAVFLLLIDGLGYEDTRHWPEAPEPVFIDGPSITFFRTDDGRILPDVGFPAIVGTPPLAQRLLRLGLSRARGYSYWERQSNDVAAVMFDGMPLERVGGMDEALGRLANESLDGLYVQMVRIGTDGLAHGRREVSPREVASTVAAVREDMLQVVEMLRGSGVPGAVYLTSDHGILWKRQHALRESGAHRSGHPRYSAAPLGDGAPVTRMVADEAEFLLYHYPFLGAAIRSNNSGVHGGLSCWESIVPFVHIEVNL